MLPTCEWSLRQIALTVMFMFSPRRDIDIVNKQGYADIDPHEGHCLATDAATCANQRLITLRQS